MTSVSHDRTASRRAGAEDWSWRRRIGLAAVLLWLATLATWMLHVGGRAPAPWLSRCLVLTAFVGAAAYLVTLARDLWRQGEGVLSAGRVVLLLTAVSLVVHLAGIQFELLDHPRSDEGVYYEEAVRINQGQALPDSFNYGHLYYYLPALVLWVQELFSGPVLAVAHWLYGLESDFAASRLLLRGLTALLGALTTIPVFWAAWRVAGLLAATMAGMLITFSTIYNSVAHEVICDVPSGFFAAVCIALTARLLDGENRRDYLLAGVAAGLAAASKYPGGVAAVAIFGMWLYWRMRKRDWSWSLFAAAAASILTLLATMPALWLRSEAATRGSGRDILFGWRQYARSGWVGVTPESIPGYYAERIASDLGWIALALGVTGLLLLNARQRRRIAALALFPVAYLALIGSMSMAVIRNLQPVLPALSVLSGVGCAGWALWLGSRRPARSRALGAAVVVAAIAWPAFHTVAWDVSHSRAGTRQQMVDWIEENLPHGTGILREDYTPDLDPRHYLRQHRRFLVRFPPEEIGQTRWDYVMVADASWVRFFPRDETPTDHRALVAKRYEEIFSWPLAAEFRPSRWRTGPRVSLYRIPLDTESFRERRRWKAAHVTWVSDEAIRPSKPEDPLRFDRRWQIAVFKDFFVPGLYEIKAFTEPLDPEAYVHVVDPENREVGSFRMRRGSAVVELPRREKYLFRVFQEPGSELSELVVRQAAPELSPTAPLPPS